MRWAQLKKGGKLHAVLAVGEHIEGLRLPPTSEGGLSAPICGEPTYKGKYYLTINVPLGEPCRRCARVLDAKGLRWNDIAARAWVATVKVGHATKEVYE